MQSTDKDRLIEKRLMQLAERYHVDVADMRRRILSTGVVLSELHLDENVQFYYRSTDGEEIPLFLGMIYTLDQILDF